MPAAPLTDIEKRRIVKALEAGTSQHAVAKASGRSVGTVNALAREHGIECSGPKKAAEARRDYAQANRLLLVNEAFDKARELLSKAQDGEELRHIVTSLGILIDKRRLEDGEATTRSEVETSDRRDRLASRLDELAARRRARDVAGATDAG